MLNLKLDHPFIHKYNVADNMAVMAIRVTDDKHLVKVTKKVFNILKQNWYPPAFVNRMWCQALIYTTKIRNNTNVINISERCPRGH